MLLGVGFPHEEFGHGRTHLKTLTPKKGESRLPVGGLDDEAGGGCENQRANADGSDADGDAPLADEPFPTRVTPITGGPIETRGEIIS